jgi:hypothetical protein
VAATVTDINVIKAPHYYDNAGFCNHCGIWEQDAPEYCELITLKDHVAAVQRIASLRGEFIYTQEQLDTAVAAAVKRARIDAIDELLGGTPLEEHDRRIIVKNYDQGRHDERMKHHANQCCRICDTHVNPHRGCILR